MTTLEPHPLALLLPRPTEEEQAALTADIEEHGLKTPIVLYEGKILDGISRHDACLTTETDPKFEEFHQNGQTAREFVLSMNLHRRHLTASQKAAIAAHELLKHQQAQPNHKKRGTDYSVELGKLYGVASASIARAHAVRKHDPQDYVKIKKGTMTVNAAWRKLQLKPDSPIRKIKSRNAAMKTPEDTCKVIRAMGQGGWDCEGRYESGLWYIRFYGHGVKPLSDWSQMKGRPSYIEAVRQASIEVNIRSYTDS